MKGKLFILSAPSGAGKTTLVTALLERFGRYYTLERVITYTSKAPRQTERPGIDYHFISPEEFERKINEGFFMEWSKCYGTYYGSPRSVLDEVARGKSFIAILDRLGAQNIVRNSYDQAILIWLYTHSMNDLRVRLEGRNTETQEQIERRLVLAQQEIYEECVSPQYHYHILNHDFERALKKFERVLRRELFG